MALQFTVVKLKDMKKSADVKAVLDSFINLSLFIT